MTLVRRLLLFDHPQETRFFAFVGVFGLVIAVIYWIVSYEWAGTVLLLAFGAAGVFAALRLGVARPAAVARGGAERDAAHPTGPEAGEGTGSGTAGIDRPFLDESGRIPGATLAPLALGLGISLASTAVIFGPWLAIAALVPFLWGAWAWFAGARDELDATRREEGDDDGRRAGDGRG